MSMEDLSKAAAEQERTARAEQTAWIRTNRVTLPATKSKLQQQFEDAQKEPKRLPWEK